MNLKSHPEPLESTSQPGILYAALAYTSWGLLPIYWKLFGSVPAVEVLSHRMIWSMVFLLVLLALQRRLPELGKLWQVSSSWKLLFATAALLTFNWGLYIYGVNTDRVVETSLGYFINPLVSVMLGFFFLKERLNRRQTIAVALAAVGVAIFIWHFGQVPWIALSLAFSFGLYGLLRKVVPVAPLVGLAAETLFIAPLALAAVSYWGITGTGQFGVNGLTTALFIGAGVTTSMPLLWFNNAAKRLPLVTLGFMQYIAPSLQLVLAVFFYREPFTQIHAVTFGLIWTALAIYSSSALRRRSPTAPSNHRDD